VIQIAAATQFCWTSLATRALISHDARQRWCSQHCDYVAYTLCVTAPGAITAHTSHPALTREPIRRRRTGEASVFPMKTLSSLLALSSHSSVHGSNQAQVHRAHHELSCGEHAHCCRVLTVESGRNAAKAATMTGG
jgi:hypothetical protein